MEIVGFMEFSFVSWKRGSSPTVRKGASINATPSPTVGLLPPEWF